MNYEPLKRPANMPDTNFYALCKRTALHYDLTHFLSLITFVPSLVVDGTDLLERVDAELERGKKRKASSLKLRKEYAALVTRWRVAHSEKIGGWAEVAA